MSKTVISKKVRMRDRGQFTIPAEFRQRLGIEEDSVLRVFEVGKALLIFPENTTVNELARQVEYKMKEAGIDLEELLTDLREGSHGYETDSDIS
ncbi:AbrB/MazE/SpoVT family DNA-binding domain-containing protein [Syntrophomonas palmitatica]|uniref:AbrB/MazE/SpoVT family DNA-binding domain-containing protein n=1 Tax=Syntrophomonas palmitatica TaxID=402877 RepID=UPI0006D19CF7|nr:AbrB/MazE/SpoVT family DNA-binding domain-containing protein [Syntrophomonas palmitatica]